MKVEKGAKVKEHIVTVNPVNFVPQQHLQGDKDFWGKVNIWAWTKFHIRADRRAFRIEFGMSASEPGWDFTMVAGSGFLRDHVLPGTERIVEIKTKASEVRYRDQTWEDDFFRGAPGELVAVWQIKGDRNGPDVGYSSMHMTFNPVVLLVE